MKQTVLLSQPIFMYSIVMVAVLGFAGTYAYTKIHQDQAEKDALVHQAEQLATSHASAEEIAVELADARTTAQKELDRLNLFVNYSNSPEALAAMREDVFENVLNVFAKNTESVFRDINNSENQQAINSQKSIQEKIIAKRADVQEVLKKWEKLVKDVTANSNQKAAAEASAYAEEIRADVQDLKNLVDQLTPENSGLTPSEIAADKADVAAAIKQIEQAVSDLGQTSVPQAVVQQQQQDVVNAQNQVGQLEQDLQQISNLPTTGSGLDQTSSTTSTGDTGNTSTVGDTTSSNTSDPNYQDPVSPNYPGTRYVPPAPVQDPTKPKLIEGANGVL